MLELVLLTLVAAVATTFALDLLRPAWKLLLRRGTARRTDVEGRAVEAHALN